MDMNNNLEWEVSHDQSCLAANTLRILSRTICISVSGANKEIDRLCQKCHEYESSVQIRSYPKKRPYVKIFAQFCTRQTAENVRQKLLQNHDIKCISSIEWGRPHASHKLIENSFNVHNGVGEILRPNTTQYAQTPIYPTYQSLNINYNFHPNPHIISPHIYQHPITIFKQQNIQTQQVNNLILNQKRKIEYIDQFSTDTKRQKLDISQTDIHATLQMKDNEIKRLKQKIGSLERQTARNDKQLSSIRMMWKQEYNNLQEQLKEIRIELQQVLCNLYGTKSELNDLKLKNTETNALLNNTKIERDRYKLIAASLRDQMLIGTEPRKGLYESCKSVTNTIEWTKNVQKLYDEISQLDSDIMVSEHHEKFNKTVFKSVSTFMEFNDKNADFKNPIVVMKGINYRLNDVVSKRKIQEGYRVPELIGKYGVFAKTDIIKNVVLGRYIGFETTNKEWNEMYDYTNQDAKHGEYLFSFNIDEYVEHNHDGSRQITVDPIEANMIDLNLLYVNDIRKNIFIPQPTKQDKALENIRFVVPKIYGWPTPMIMTTKKIKKGDELLLDYGNGFSVFLKQNKRWQRMIQASQDNISNNIIRNVQLDDRYEL
eukprot:338082_1